MWIARFIVFLAVSFFTNYAYAQTSVTAIALFKDRAMLSIDGHKAKIVRAGSTYKGVLLISSNTDQAIVEINGATDVLELNGTTIVSDQLGAFKQSGDAVVEIRVNRNGFFRSLGAINGREIEFLVDTGASLVVLSSEQANAIGLSYLDGKVGYASTASGTAPMYNITLDSIRLGAIQLQNIEAGVIEGGFPEIPLLGMTFLSNVDMQRSGNLMTLKE